MEMLKPKDHIRLKVQHRHEEFSRVKGLPGDSFYIRCQQEGLGPGRGSLWKVHRTDGFPGLFAPRAQAIIAIAFTHVRCFFFFGWVWGGGLGRGQGWNFETWSSLFCGLCSSCGLS